MTSLAASPSVPKSDSPARDARKPRPRPRRSIRLVLGSHPDGHGLVWITVGKKVDPYWLSCLPAAAGERAFCLEKPDGQIHHVALLADGQTCDCPGFTYRGRCKHVAGLAALVHAGKL
jgi:hypothetical protein